MVTSQNSRKTLSHDVNTLRSDLRKLKTDSGILAKDTLAVGRSSIIEAKGQLQSTLKAGMVRGRRSLRQASKIVIQRPGTSLAAAFGVGLVLGLVAFSPRD